MKEWKQNKKINIKNILIVLAVLVIIFSLGFIVYHNRLINYETSFQKMMNEKNYAEALDIYHEIQSNATDSKMSNRKRQRYIEIQEEYEELVSNKTEKILERLENGENLTNDDQAFILGMDEVTSSVIAPYLTKITENWLDQKIDYDEWRYILDAFQGFPNLELNVKTLLDQETELKIAAEKFKATEELDIKENWNKIWESWSNLTTDEEIGRFATNYASYRLQTFQDDLYKILMQDVDLYIEQNRYYSAKIVLDRLFDAFPNQSAIQEKLNICNENIPSNLITWEDTVESISVKPLLVDISQAKKGKSKYFAENELITAAEFENLLNELYENDYVLISPNLYFNYPDNYSEVVVPKGKKPIILIFESYQYSADFQEAGTAAKLAYNKDNDSFYSYLNRNDPESICDTDVDAIPILEQFISTHNNFSFNGARALISLNANENLFGYIIKSQQLNNYIDDMSDLGLPISSLINMTDEEKENYFQKEYLPLAQLISGLKYHNYYFCNGTYSNQELDLLDLNEFKSEIENWEDICFPYLGKTQALLFPNGSHIYANQDKLDYLLEKGYVNFYSQGADAYNYMSDEYFHFNYIPIKKDSLTDSESWQLDRLVNVNNIVESWRDE